MIDSKFKYKTQYEWPKQCREYGFYNLERSLFRGNIALAKLVINTEYLGYTDLYDEVIRKAALDCLMRKSPLGKILYGKE